MKFECKTGLVRRNGALHQMGRDFDRRPNHVLAFRVVFATRRPNGRHCGIFQPGYSECETSRLAVSRDLLSDQTQEYDTRAYVYNSESERQNKPTQENPDVVLALLARGEKP